MRRATLLAGSLSAACGGSWSAEDIEFVRGLPTRQDLTLSVPAPAGTQRNNLAGDLGSRQDPLLGQSTVYRDAVNTANGVNAFVSGLTSGLDYLRTVPPSVREPNRRIWGPHPDEKHPEFEWRLVIVKNGPQDYGYVGQLRRRGVGEFVGLLAGRFLGDRATDGTGEIQFDNDQARALGSSDDVKTSQVALAYDMTGGVARATMQIRAVEGAVATVTFTVRPDGGGALGFSVTASFDGTPTPAAETLAVVARWLPDKSGRVDVHVTGGDLGSAVGAAIECWDVNFCKVYTARNFECPAGQTTCSEGDPKLCTLPP